MHSPVESTLYSLENGHALVLKALPRPSQQRIPTHFIMVIDTSDSMADNGKLTNVKHSASLVLNFLGSQDCVSIVTFGEQATIVANAVVCSQSQKEALAATLERIRTDGCTNLSSGLLEVRKVLGAAPSALKTGVLLLTDGHANRGVSNAADLKEMVKQIHQEFPAVTYQFVGYGTDHNSELLKGMAEHTQGAYSIVADKEGAATVIGDSLGSLFSCVAQQVEVCFGPGATVEGTQFKCREDGTVFVGDLYEENETLLLVNGTSASVSIKGVALPSMAEFTQTIPLGSGSAEVPEALGLSVVLTRARYKISSLFRTLRESRLGTSIYVTVESEVATLETLLREARFAGNPVATALLAECTCIQDAIEIYRTGTRGDVMETTSHIINHEATTALGRGTTQSIARGPRRFPSMAAAGPEDPTNPVGYMRSPFQNRRAQRVTELMTVMSAGGDSLQEAVHEASQMSQNGV